ncbi:MAG: orotidine-5'-phosphate decarboxylase [Saprospiraceae bacterium]|nr:orotidine-5'-phosphate decarboxylase [Saprospiraceae bacterium]
MNKEISSQRTALFRSIQANRSFLCVGLDPDVDRLPQGLPRSPEGVLIFLRAIIQSTAPYCVAYKPNFAFFEALGPEGAVILQQTIQSIPADKLIIGDAKRGDIGNTAKAYAKAVFDEMKCDAITVSPYMGVEALTPFMAYPDKWTIALALTSNPGSQDYQRLILEDGGVLWERVMSTCAAASDPDHLMFVVGGTHPHDFRRVREIAPDHFLLVPGFGAQQGSLREVADQGFNDHCGILANVSRAILYASDMDNYAQEAANMARQYQSEMAELLMKAQLITSV